MVQNFTRMPPDPLEGIFAVLIFIERIAQHSDHNRVTARQRLLKHTVSVGTALVSVYGIWRYPRFSMLESNMNPAYFVWDEELGSSGILHVWCDSRCLYRVSVSAAAAEASHWQWHCDGDLPGGRLRTLLPTLHSLPLPTHFHRGPCREVQHTVPQVQVCAS